MKHGSLFSGIGGFELAAEWMGWDNIKRQEESGIGKQRNVSTGDNEWLRAYDDKIGSITNSNSNRFYEFRQKECGKKSKWGKKTEWSSNRKFIENFESGYRPDDFKEFPSKPAICDGDDGISDRLDAITFSDWRKESIKAGGNAIVPQVAHQIFKAIQEYERCNGRGL